MADLAMQMKKRSDGRQQQSRQKTNKKYFNCRKTGYYAKDCRLATKRKPEDEKASEKLKHAPWMRNRATKKAFAARSAN